MQQRLLSSPRLKKFERASSTQKQREKKASTQHSSKLAAIKLKPAGSCAYRFGPVFGPWTTWRCKGKAGSRRVEL